VTQEQALVSPELVVSALNSAAERSWGNCDHFEMSVGVDGDGPLFTSRTGLSASIHCGCSRAPHNEFRSGCLFWYQVAQCRPRRRVSVFPPPARGRRWGGSSWAAVRRVAGGVRGRRLGRGLPRRTLARGLSRHSIEHRRTPGELEGSNKASCTELRITDAFSIPWLRMLRIADCAPEAVFCRARECCMAAWHRDLAPWFAVTRPEATLPVKGTSSAPPRKLTLRPAKRSILKLRLIRHHHALSLCKRKSLLGLCSGRNAGGRLNLSEGDSSKYGVQDKRRRDFTVISCGRR